MCGDLYMYIALLIIMPVILFFRLLLILFIQGLRFLHKTGFLIAGIYIIVVIVLYYALGLNEDQPVPDYLNLGLTTLEDYLYLGLKICVGIGCIFFVIKIVQFIRKFF